MQWTNLSSRQRRRYVIGDEDLADLEVLGLTYGGPVPGASADLAGRQCEPAHASVTIDPHRRAVVCAVANDGSSEAVIEAACGLAVRLGLRLTLVHSPDSDLFLIGEPHRAALARGHALLDRVADSCPTAERVVQTGDPAALVTGTPAIPRAGA